jgi:hypothetical protein
MAAAQVSDDVANRIVTRVDGERRLYPRRLTGPIAVAAVKNHVLVDGDRLEQAALNDIGHEFVKLSALKQRENVGQRVKLERHCHCKSSRPSPSGPSAGLLCLR